MMEESASIVPISRASSAEPVEPNLRRVGHSDLDPFIASRPKP